MPAIGQTLREARMRQGFDVADLEQRTKIRAKYLRALENEEWEALPGHTFVKTFLRTYAEQVGLDPHMLVEEYRMSHESEERDFAPLAGPPAALRRETRRDRRRPAAAARPGPPGRGPLIVLAVLAIVVFIFVLGLFGEDNPASDRAGDEPPKADPVAQPRERARARPRPTRPAGVTLRIEPSVPTYACVDNGVGTEVVFEGTLAEAETFRNRQIVRVNLGKRSVELQANGKPVEVTDSPEAIGYEVTRDGAQEIVDGARPCT
ncbi:MAG: helix-turn-helix domain-containing protein [Thermoleophilaceae bacterium]